METIQNNREGSIKETLKEIRLPLSDGSSVVLEVSGGCKEVTWEELVTLRDEGSLIPGGYYRITDFITTVGDDPEARSAGHPFDLIILALSGDTLSEEARATRSPRETDDYFKDAHLEAWKVWYCLDNDISRFQWADTETGKGVIYRLIDEWGNDCPYDFKNIQFKRYHVTSDDSLNSVFDSKYVGYPGMSFPSDRISLDDPEDFIWAFTFSMPKVDLKKTPLEFCEDDKIGYLTEIFDVRDSIVDNEYCTIDPHNQQDASLNFYRAAKLHGNGVNGVRNNKIQQYYSVVRVDDSEIMVLSLNNIVMYSSPEAGDTGKEDYISNSLKMSNGGNNEIYWFCYNITALEGFSENCLGSNSRENLIGKEFSWNVFGSQCRDNMFGNFCSSNTFGEGTSGNMFESYCVNNTFGNLCGDNIFGFSCSNNTFGNNCRSNIFGDYCLKNTFGGECQRNTFGNSCFSNTFGEECGDNIFGNSLKHITLGKKVQYLEVTDGENAQILSGTSGSIRSFLTVTIPKNKDGVMCYVGLNSNGELKIWNPADLI